jgi:WS/DGAT/MGAT family acyltransferase
MHQLNPVDAMMVASEQPRMPMHVSAIFFCDPSTAEGELTFDGVLDYLQRRLHVASAFRQRLVRVPLALDMPYWIDDPDFDLEFHVRQIALPKPGDWAQLRTQIARLHARRLDMTRPPWELTIIEGLDNIPDHPIGSFAVVLKIHHAAIDGMSGAAIMSALLTPTPDTSQVPAGTDEWRPDDLPSARALLLRAATHTLSPWRLSGLLRRSAPALPALPRTVLGELQGKRDPIPNTRFGQAAGGHQVFERVQVSLDQARKIRGAAEGATLNDVALTWIAGALRHYLANKNELPDTPLRVGVPISTRASTDARGGNQVAGRSVPLFTSIADPVERLGLTRQATIELKQSGVKGRRLQEVSQHLPGALIGLGMRVVPMLTSVIKLPMNTVVTNVPGPRDPLYLFGARVLEMPGAGPLVNGCLLVHIVSSYVDQFGCSVNADRKAIPDPSFYADCLRTSFDEMAAAAL